MKNILLHFVTLFISAAALAQGSKATAYEPDQYVSEAINSEDWFLLDSRYNECRSRLSPFVDTLSQCFLHHAFNRPDSALLIYPSLLNNHQPELAAAIPAIMWMMAGDLTKIGDYSTAADILETLSKAMEDAGQDASRFRGFTASYRALSSVGRVLELQDLRPDGNRIPILLGNPGNHGVIALPVSSGNETDTLIFDTGAGVNLVTTDCARRLGMRLLDAEILVSGITGGSHTSARLAVADTLHLGDITILNVPFYVADLTTGHEVADTTEWIRRFRGAIGPALFSRFEEIQINLSDSTLFIPSSPTALDISSNLCISSGILYLRLRHNGHPANIKFDTGSATSFINDPGFYTANKDFILSNGIPDTLRIGGMGGIEISYGHTLPLLTVGIYDTPVTLDSVFVRTGSASSTQTPSTIGCDLLMRCDKAILNMRDMYLYLKKE